MKGQFGVFSGKDMLAEFDDDEAAAEYRHVALELHLPEYVRRPAYDDLEIRSLDDDDKEEQADAAARV